MEIKAGQKYRHFKGMEYEILAVGMETETEGTSVVYRALYGDHQVFIRPYEMFVSEVDHEKYPEVKQQYRFEMIEEAPKGDPMMEFHFRKMGEMFANEKLQKVRNYKELNQKAVPGQILFTGSSLMEQFPVNEIAMSDGCTKLLYNRGIGGTTTDEFLKEFDTVCGDLKPAKMFINIGTNDINERPDGTDWFEHLMTNLTTIYQRIREEMPACDVYVMAYYPVNPEANPEMAKVMLKTRTNETVARVNTAVQELAASFGFHYIDVNDGIKDAEGKLRLDLTKEGMHMYAGAYQIIYDALKKYL